MYSQISWYNLKGKKLTLCQYGLYRQGKEVNVFYPSNLYKNANEYIYLNINGTLTWANSGNG